MKTLRPLLAISGLCLAALLAWSAWWRGGPGSVVVYCAHDAVFAAAVLEAFTARTGIPVAVRYDTEATKSLGLVERLCAQAEAPECDVFWNNEQLGTMDLADRGLLAVHPGGAWERIPAAFRDAEGRWTGFAARLRVVVENTGVADVSRHASDQGAMAKPLYGTTLTQYCAQWALTGAEATKAWHHLLRRQGLREVDGNAMVRRLVADGVCAWGWTDSDDAFEALDAGKPVRLVPVRLVPATPGPGAEPSGGATIVIPNTVAVLRGAPHPAAAHRLADFLASAEVEMMLARSASRQIPLGAVDEAQLPTEVRALRGAVAAGLPLGGLLAARAQVLAWLKEEYAR